MRRRLCRLLWPAGLVLVFVHAYPRSADARCGKNSEQHGRTSCDASSGDLLLKFENHGGAANNDPLDDEQPPGTFVIRAGNTAGVTEATDPIVLAPSQARLHGGATRFTIDRFLRIADSTPSKLKSKFEAYVSFWIRAREIAASGSHDVISMREETPSGNCGAAVFCENYSVRILDTATPGKFDLAFIVWRNIGANQTQQTCRANATLSVPLFDYGKWHHVTIGGMYSGNVDNAGAAGEGRFRVVVDGVQYQTLANPAGCLDAGGGMAASREWVTDANGAGPMALFVGSHPGVSNDNADFDLDELRIDAWDSTEVLSVNCGATKPGCLGPCRVASPTGCARGLLNPNTIGSRGDPLGGVAITQVLFNDPGNWQSVLLYRKFETSGVIDLNPMVPGPSQICESSTAGTEDDGVESCWFTPAVPAPLMAPGDFLQVFLCEDGAVGCLADSATPPSCKQYYTRSAADQLGFGAVIPGSCNAGTCLNGNLPTLEADYVTLLNNVDAEKGGVAWMSASRASPLALGLGLNGETADFGLWPVDYIEATGTLLGHEALRLSNDVTVQGFKLRTVGSNTSPDVTDATPANRDWAEIFAGSPRAMCLGTNAAVTHSGGYVLDFRGEGRKRAVELTWVTDDETVLSGFNLFRAEHPDGPYQPVGEFIPVHGSVAGESYTYLDSGLEPGLVVWYGLEVFDSDGAIVESWPRLQVVVPDSRSPGCSAAPVDPAWTTVPSGVCILAVWLALARRSSRKR